MMTADFDGFRKEWIYEARVGPVMLPHAEFGTGRGHPFNQKPTRVPSAPNAQCF